MSSVLLNEWHAHIQACCATSEEKYCREVSAIEWMAAHFGLVARQTDPEHVTIGNAVLALRSLQVVLKNLPLEAQFEVVSTRVKRAISIQSSDESGSALDNVFPRLRPPPDSEDLSWFESIAGGRLLECLVSEESDVVRYLDPLRIIGFGLGVQGLRSHSRTNLRARKAVFLSASDEPRIKVCRMGDGHDAARLLVVCDLIPSMDRVLCCAPDRDTLLCADPADADIQTLAYKMREMAVRLASQAAYPLSAECFLVEGEAVRHVPFHTDETGAFFSGF
ncbi:MAG: hypothetical protein CL930_05680 [Deltaproteobacteria bacterium]|nr:hypothetical protein [Deltaproteobacteria bacterium]